MQILAEFSAVSDSQNFTTARQICEFIILKFVHIKSFEKVPSAATRSYRTHPFKKTGFWIIF